jgi:hypothetical protein
MSKPSCEIWKRYYALRREGTDLYLEGLASKRFRHISFKTWTCGSKKVARAVLREMTNIYPKMPKCVVVPILHINSLRET